jgi:para-nitrobenzyl esterase
MPRHRLTRAITTAITTTLALALTMTTAGATPAAGPPGGAASAASAGNADTVVTADGAVRGTVSADGRRFSGIPYAAPPTGALRFAAPRPATPWSGVRDATGTPPTCPQFGPVPTEDCLILNVSTPPVTSRRPLPVMVWFHGGAYSLGSAAGYDPTPLVTRGGVIVVGVNYRLGPLGFLTLPGSGAEDGRGVSNAAVLDQQAALRWVRRNVAAFGGDPRNVTIFGESAGGHAVCMQLVSPAARGLFRRAISQSGGCVGTGLGPIPASEARTRSLRFAAAVGCTDPATALACLRTKPVADLVAASGGFLSLEWVPTLDGTVLPRTAQEALASGRYHRVPLVVGSNRDEGRLFVLLQYHLALQRPITQQEYETAVRNLIGADAPAVLARYPSATYGSPDLALSAVLTDRLFACPAVATVAAATRGDRGHGWGHRTPVFQYEFDDPQAPPLIPDPFMPLGAYHSAELYSLFATIQGIPPSTPLTPAQRQLSDEMIRYWTTFARTGDPNPRWTRAWPTARGRDPAVLSLRPGGASRVVRTVDDVHQCGFWLTRP